MIKSNKKAFNESTYIIETKYKCSLTDLYKKVGKEKYGEIVGAHFKKIKYGR